MDNIDTVLAMLPPTDVANVMVLDVWLGSKSAGDPATGCPFTEEIWDRYRDTPNATHIRIFLSNPKAADVEALEGLDIPLGVIIAGCGCAHRF